MNRGSRPCRYQCRSSSSKGISRLKGSFIQFIVLLGARVGEWSATARPWRAAVGTVRNRLFFKRESAQAETTAGRDCRL
jgi:hypothetical protein